MGKKSISGPSHLESPEDAAISSVPMAFSPSLRAILEDMKELLTRELLKILLQERLLDENQGKHNLADQVSTEEAMGGREIRMREDGRQQGGSSGPDQDPLTLRWGHIVCPPGNPPRWAGGGTLTSSFGRGRTLHWRECSSPRPTNPTGEEAPVSKEGL